MSVKDDLNNEKPVKNPCVGVCALDQSDICIACHRSGIEICEWGVLTEAQKVEVLKKIARREQGEIC